MRTASERVSNMWSQKSKATRANNKSVSDAVTKQDIAPSTQIWKSRLSWRITLAVFLTIMTVQVGIMSMTIHQERETHLFQLVEEGRSAVAPLIPHTMRSLGDRVIDPLALDKMLTQTRVQGLSIYTSVDGQLLGTYGQPPIISIIYNPQTGLLSVPENYYSSDGTFYNAILTPRMINEPYYVVLKLDSNHIQTAVAGYVNQTIYITLLMSAFVTTVLMIALGHWLLEPIFFMRQSLLKAFENPEKPKIVNSPFDSKDEIGGAIDMALQLIRQNAQNIAQIKSAAEDQIHKLAFYDTLTGLPNRTLFLQRLAEQARQNGEGKKTDRFAVIALDLDHFKDINDSMGHNVGDAILRAVGKRLRAALPEGAVVARSGGDEFAVTMALSTDVNSAVDIAHRIVGVIRSEPFKVFNENFQIRASVGVSTFPDDGVDPDQVLKNADIALNRAKEEGRDRIKEYSEDFDRAVQQRFQMLRDLRDAMEQDQLLLHFQPQFELQSGRLIGAETLIRWWKPDNSKQGGSFIPPVDFIPIAEQSGLIVPIGEWVLRGACAAAAKWQEKGQDLRIAVNVSGAQFYQADIVAITQKILEETGLKPHNLELEVTESVFMEDISHAINTLQQLHGLGVELAIDDFGTGYSSLSYLRQFPIDRLKIDQSFIRNALNNADDAAIARTIVKLGHSLNLKVIAEGVETREHEEFLLKEECDEVQGYRYSKPVPLADFEQFAESYNGNLASFDA